MPQLTDKELALLSSLIYCDYMITNGQGADFQTLASAMLSDDFDWDPVSFSGDFYHLETTHDRGRAEAIDRYTAVLREAGQSPGLQNITITEPVLRDGPGITAATFVDNHDNSATIVFRGTDGSYKQWNDNFEGAGDDVYTPMQKLAMDYTNRISARQYSSITATGHSKGGNLAVFAAVMCPVVNRCVNFDGQGFSETFINEYSSEIAGSRDKITTIAAYNDFVNILLFPISGETIYVFNNNANGAERHYITNIIRDGFDDNGNLISGKQDFLMFLLGNGIELLLKAMPGHTEEIVTDVISVYASLYLGKADITEDDVIHMLSTIASNVFNLTDDVIDRFSGIIRSTFINAGARYTAGNPYFKADTAMLRKYAADLGNVNNRIVSLDKMLDSLYWQVGFSDLIDILHLNLEVQNEKKIQKAANYLNAAGDILDTAERKAGIYMGG